MSRHVVPVCAALLSMFMSTPTLARSARKFIAANDAEPAVKARADVVCSGTHDEVCLQAGLDSLSGGGRLVLSDGTFNLEAPLYLGNTPSTRENITLEGQGQSTYLNAKTNYPLSQAPDTIIRRFNVRDLQIGTTTHPSMIGLTVRSALFSNFENITIKGSTSGTAIYLAPDSSSIVNRYVNNCAHNTFKNISVEESYAGINLIGYDPPVDGSCDRHVVTLNRFEDVALQGITGYGIIFTSCADNNYFSNIHIYINSNGATGVLHNNSDTPLGSVGLYANNFVNLAIDAFTYSSVKGIHFRKTKQNTVLGFYRSPEFDIGNGNNNVLVYDDPSCAGGCSDSHYILNNGHQAATGTPQNNWIETLSKNVEAH